MISFNEAQSLLFQHPYQAEILHVSLLEAKGMILAEDIINNRAAPPFNRIAMDGISIAFADLEILKTAGLFVEKSTYAGDVQTEQISGTCIKVMTGGVVPKGADTVIRIEDIDINGKTAFLKEGASVKIGQNIHKMGSDCALDELLLREGTLIKSQQLAVLATLGYHEVKVRSKPKVGIVSTGDELVPVNATPQPHQIRQSNPYFLAGICQEYGLDYQMIHLPDEPSALSSGLKSLAKQVDVLLISGGVSMGERDYVAQTLHQLGVQQHFHRVAQRPGKPLYFGSSTEITVFGFPGNPISVSATATSYFIPWLRKSGICEELRLEAVLSKDIQFKAALTYLLPVSVSNVGGVYNAIPVDFNGSGDVLSLSTVDGFLELQAKSWEFPKGTTYNYYPVK